MNQNNINLEGRNVVGTQQGISTPNAFITTTGAATPGYGKFLVVANRTLETDVVPKKLRMQSYDNYDNYNLSQVVELNVVEAAMIPASGNVDSIDASTDLNELLIYDLRARGSNTDWTLPVSKYYNVLNDDFQTYSPDTMDANDNPWTWDRIITDLEVITLHKDVVLPTFEPKNIILDGISLAQAVDEIAGQLYLVAAYDYVTDKIKLYKPGTLETVNRNLFREHIPIEKRFDRTVVRYGDQLPNRVDVLFKLIRPDNGYDDYTQKYFIPRIDITSWGSITNTSKANGIMEMEVGNLFAIEDETGSIINEIELTENAEELVSRATNLMFQEINEVKYAGMLPFVLDGKIREIRWHIDTEYGATTTIIFHNKTDKALWDTTGDSNKLTYNHEHVGISGVNISATPSGTRIVSQQNNKVKWGKATEAWESGDDYTITIKSCDKDGVLLKDPYGEDVDITAYITTPIEMVAGTDVTPTIFPKIAENDVLAYLPTGYREGVIINCNWDFQASIAEFLGFEVFSKKIWYKGDGSDLPITIPLTDYNVRYDTFILNLAAMQDIGPVGWETLTPNNATGAWFQYLNPTAAPRFYSPGLAVAGASYNAAFAVTTTGITMTPGVDASNRLSVELSSNNPVLNDKYFHIVAIRIAQYPSVKTDPDFEPYGNGH